VIETRARIFAGPALAAAVWIARQLRDWDSRGSDGNLEPRL
jgi:hypothetical protein